MRHPATSARPTRRNGKALARAGAALALDAPAADADHYKCRGANGTPIYQDSACPAGTELRDFQADPPSVSVVPFEKPPAPPPATGRKSTSKSSPGEAKSSRRASTVVRNGKADPNANAGERRFLHRGMSEAEVLARIGPPDVKSGSPSGKGGGRWSYLPQPNDPQMITTLTFAHGEVSDIERKMVR